MTRPQRDRLPSKAPVAVAPPVITSPAREPAAVGRGQDLSAIPVRGGGSASADVDLEAVTPEEADRLRRQGVELPTVSQAGADPRSHGDYVDRQVEAVAYGIYLGGFLVFCTGMELPILVPEGSVDLGPTPRVAASVAVHPDHGAAMNVVPYGPHAKGAAQPYAYFRVAGGAVIAPTVFSPVTTPRTVALMDDARRELVRQVQEELTILAMAMVGGKLIEVVFAAGGALLSRLRGRLSRVRSTPEPPPPSGKGPAPEPSTTGPKESRPPQGKESWDVGRNVVRWGESQSAEAVAQTRAVTESLTPQRVQQMAGEGLTKQWVEKQLAMYEQMAAQGGKKLANKQLLPRLELMRKLLRLWPQ